MCLQISVAHHYPLNKPLIASKDILVWKIISDENCSKYQGFQYKPNTVYKLSSQLKLANGREIAEGYHAYTSRQEARNHFFDVHHKVVKFVIPKGTEYFVGIRSDIVSNKIKSLDLKRQ